ncbi:YfhO family protein [Myxococcus sp. K15C18031901]|uniref:YfhO family protein n=1 Tax=Myxococcus dinghuensis TaxID=2906761 RepID=UPI0020A83478|nr:YfhO family protein [Myxococcus dinghuensis]MCP3099958.1 YfhO family protein [Myxococcus dinghuensis]
MSARRGPGTKGWLAIAGLLALLAFAYSPALRGELLAGRDVFRVFFPDSAFLLESLRAGELPLWNPYLRLGQPFAATLYSQVFYPPRWAAVLVAGPIVSMTVLHIAHAALAAVGVFLLARRLRASWPASLVAGAMFGLSPMMTDLGIQQNVVDAAAWSGFILLAAHDLAHRPSRGALVRLAICSALSLFAGSPETTLWQGILAVLVTVLSPLSRASASRTTTSSPAAEGIAPIVHLGSSGTHDEPPAVAVAQAGVGVPDAMSSHATTRDVVPAETRMEAHALDVPLRDGPPAPAQATSSSDPRSRPRDEATSARVRAIALARVVGGFVLSAVLASVVLLPALEFTRNSLRSQRGWSEQLAWSVSWPQVLSTVWPLADWPRDRYWGEDQWFILNLFLGTLPVALAVVGALRGPRRARPYWVGALLLVLLSLGRHFPPAAWVIQTLPPFSLFRYPAKYFVGAAFCLSVLSAFGIDAMGRFAHRVPPSRLKAAVAFVGMGVAIGAVGPLVRMLPMRASAEAGAPWVPFSLGLAALVVLLLPWSFARPRRVRHGLAALAVLELAGAHSLLGVPKYTAWEPLRQPFSLRSLLPSPFQGRISADIEGPEDPTRAVVTNTIERSLDRLMPNRFVEERLPALEGYGAPEPLRTDRFHLAGERGVYDLAGVTHYIRQGPPPFEDLELLHEAEDGTTLSRSRTALPRAFLVQHARVVTDAEALEAVIAPEQPFRKTAFLASGAPLERPACDGAVSTVSAGLQHLELDVEACDESYLVVSDSHYPGWRATVDGEETPIHRADHSLRAVQLTAGAHRVRFDYAPLSFQLGLGLSLLGWAGVAGVGLGLDRRRRLLG